MKKILAIVLALIQICCCLTACTGQGATNAGTANGTEDSISYAFPSETPSFTQDYEFELVAFWPPPPTEEYYQEMKDSGITTVHMCHTYGNEIDSDQLMATLELCDKIGLKVYISAERNYVLKFAADYSQFECFQGFNTDEPLNKDQLLVIEQSIQVLEDRYPEQDYNFWTNMIHCTENNDYFGDEFSTYQEFWDFYMEHGGKNQKLIGFDIYPLQGRQFSGTINLNWLKSLEVVAATAKKYDVAMCNYIGSMSIRSCGARRPAEDDIRYQAYVNMAYGAKGLAYFTYCTPASPPYNGEFAASDYAMLNRVEENGVVTYPKTEIYTYVQNVNNEIKALEDVFLSFDWEGTMRSAGSEATTTAGKNCFREAKNWLKSHDGIKSFKSTEDTIMGVFKNEDGYDGFMLVNFSDPLYDCTNDVTLQFRGATRAIVYINGQQQIVNLTDGTYSVTLQPGEGQFIIPLA